MHTINSDPTPTAAVPRSQAASRISLRAATVGTAKSNNNDGNSSRVRHEQSAVNADIESTMAQIELLEEKIASAQKEIKETKNTLEDPFDESFFYESEEGSRSTEEDEVELELFINSRREELDLSADFERHVTSHRSTYDGGGTPEYGYDDSYEGAYHDDGGGGDDDRGRRQNKTLSQQKQPPPRSSSSPVTVEVVAATPIHKYRAATTPPLSDDEDDDNDNDNKNGADNSGRSSTNNSGTNRSSNSPPLMSPVEDFSPRYASPRSGRNPRASPRSGKSTSPLPSSSPQQQSSSSPLPSTPTPYYASPSFAGGVTPPPRAAADAAPWQWRRRTEKRRRFQPAAPAAATAAATAAVRSHGLKRRRRRRHRQRQQ